jgi:hypothetical protein
MGFSAGFLPADASTDVLADAAEDFVLRIFVVFAAFIGLAYISKFSEVSDYPMTPIYRR